MTNTNNVIVNMASNEIINDLYAAKCRRQVNDAIGMYLNRCFHVQSGSKSMEYDGTRVSMYFIGSDGIDIEFTSKDGTHYNWAIRYIGETVFGHTNYVDGYFNSTDVPPYVENVMWNLYNILTTETGIFQLNTELDVR